MTTIELPAVEINAHSLEHARRAALVVLSLLSFWVMAAATTSHHGMYHYEYYPALTFFVWVGVVSFLYNGGLAVARAVGGVSEDLLRPLEAYAPVVLLWLCYTAAVAASATSTVIHTTFDEADGPVCRARQSHARAEAGSYFCGHVVSAIVFMYGLVVCYGLGLARPDLSSFVPEASSGDGGSGGGGFAGTTGYQEVGEPEAGGGQGAMNL
mmetsp:Transcript_16350/g.48798  ORF Transcript_16350/g.48798 Transcript_16350/m.48798 type:complete len:211 (+) Transcript_16350:224-856(+)